MLNRRIALKWIGAAAALGVAGPRIRMLEPGLLAQAPIEWNARLAALPRAADDEIVVVAVGDMMI